MFAAILAFILKIASSGLVDKAVAMFASEQNIEGQNSQAVSAIKLEAVKAYVAETMAMTELSKAKLTFPWYWVLVSLFIVPLALWWSMVLLDSIFLFPFDVADLPTIEMKTWAGNMIQFLFYTGSVTLGLKTLFK